MSVRHHPIKSLGQHFLSDIRIQQKIAGSASFQDSDTVLEIGPGKGAITKRILPLVKKLIAIERDKNLVALLKEECQESHLEIIQGDFLKLDMDPFPAGLIVMGNIPYYISTPIIEKILTHKDKIQRAFLTVQWEFGQRLAAQAGNKDYGSLSCFIQYYADVKVLFKISSACFSPRPKVDSCFVTLAIKTIPGHRGEKNALPVQAEDERKLFNMIQKAFTQRRKTIVNALQMTTHKADLLLLLERLHINPQARPEDLTLFNYIELSNAL